MSPVEQNYFTCTLGHALQRKQQGLDPVTSPAATIIDLLEEQATHQPHAPALGFANFKASPLGNNAPNIVTFEELHNRSISAVGQLLKHVGPAATSSPETCIALLCRSSMDFVFAWLGLARLGYSVLLLAPQLEPPAIRHLCATLGVNVIFVDSTYAHRASSVGGSIKVFPVPETSKAYLSVKIPDAGNPPRVSQTAFICHTSGTSSGLPKPIPQAQFGVVGALPRFSGENQPATFSATPLYHGGLADTCRAWTSGAMIWLFPEGLAPITGATLVKAIEWARGQSPVPIKYFTSVPYILQMLAEEDKGIHLLQGMDLVGVGGAALPAAVGDQLVERGVNLLSRMGSAECGFLMSSHREYRQDKDWQFLRPVDMPQLLSFEERDGGLFELIVRPEWPFLVKTNCADGSYATADLFERHPSIPNSWRYHSRADAQIALANGKKFDPSPMEASILASTGTLRDVLIFGAAKDYPGILLFPTTNEANKTDIVDSVWPIIERMNSTTQGHARLSKSMLTVVFANDEQPLEKSSKGTILRRQAEEKYAREIESAYNSVSGLNLDETASAEQLSSVVQECFEQVLGREVDPDADLYRQGVDSISCIKIRKMVESSCVPQARRPLPLNIVYDQGTIAALCAYLLRLRDGRQTPDGYENPTDTALMKELAQKYSNFDTINPGPPETRPVVVVLTGATGLLGAHILHLLRQESRISKVYCLVRAKTPEQAFQRVDQALAARCLPRLETKGSQDNRGVVCLPCDLSRKDLGFSTDHQHGLLAETTTYIHAAWTVNFTLRLGSFEDQIVGLRNLMDWSRRGRSRFLFISSTAAVSSSTALSIPEAISHEPSEASPLGYSQSKWVAEQIVVAANESIDPMTPHGAEINPSASIIRVGQLCGNQEGVWNVSEAYPLMLSTASITGCLPDLPQEALNWMPVELAAEAVVELSISGSKSEGGTAGINGCAHYSSTPVYHVLNPHNTPTWSQMLHWIKKNPNGPDIDLISPTLWVRQLEEAVATKVPNHPSQALIGVWRARYCGASGRNGDETRSADPVFEVFRTQKASPTMREVQPISTERFLKMWNWIQENVRGE